MNALHAAFHSSDIHVNRINYPEVLYTSKYVYTKERYFGVILRTVGSAVRVASVHPVCVFNSMLTLQRFLLLSVGMTTFALTVLHDVAHVYCTLHIHNDVSVI